MKINKIIEGQWATSFDLLIPENNKDIAASILAHFHFGDDGNFKATQWRNKDGVVDIKTRSGTYNASWHATENYGSGAIYMKDDQPPKMDFIIRTKDEIHFLLSDPEGLKPIAQGILRRVTIFGSSVSDLQDLPVEQ